MLAIAALRSRVTKLEAAVTNKKPRRRPSAGVSCSVQCRDQNFAPIETVKVAGGAQPWKNTVGSDCVR